MRGGERFAVQVRDTIMELVVIYRDKDASISVKGMEDGKSGIAAVVVMSEV